MNISDFAALHREELIKDEIRNNLVLSIVNHALDAQIAGPNLWSLEKPGACALQQPGYGIALGQLDQDDAKQLAEVIGGHEFPSVIGADQSADWFVEAAKTHGHCFPKVRRETVHVLSCHSVVRDVIGSPRMAIPHDLDIVISWLNAFGTEALPGGQSVQREEALDRINKGRVYLWCVRKQPVAMSCVGRVLGNAASIAPVYTIPDKRGRGYAGAITAFVAQAIISRNYKQVFLYTDDTNPAASRCYEKIGFQVCCESAHYLDVSRP